jgi:hypothetical protein
MSCMRGRSFIQPTNQRPCRRFQPPQPNPLRSAASLARELLRRTSHRTGAQACSGQIEALTPSSSPPLRQRHWSVFGMPTSSAPNAPSLMACFALDASAVGPAALSSARPAPCSPCWCNLEKPRPLLDASRGALGPLHSALLGTCMAWLLGPREVKFAAAVQCWTRGEPVHCLPHSSKIAFPNTKARLAAFPRSRRKRRLAVASSWSRP